MMLSEATAALAAFSQCSGADVRTLYLALARTRLARARVELERAESQLVAYEAELVRLGGAS